MLTAPITTSRQVRRHHATQLLVPTCIASRLYSSMMTDWWPVRMDCTIAGEGIDGGVIADGGQPPAAALVGTDTTGSQTVMATAIRPTPQRADVTRSSPSDPVPAESEPNPATSTPRDRGSATLADPALTPQQVLARLRPRYGALRWRPHHDPLTELVLTILSQHTNDTNSGKAFAAMQRAFPTWDAVLTAAPTALADSIRLGGLANQKAPRIQAVLRQVQSERGAWNLDFLTELPLEAAKAWLRALPGVGPKTAACVLMFALGRPALPVDTHVYRVSKRLGLIAPTVSADAAHALLEAQTPPAEMYAFHIALIKHGRHTCTARTPRCTACPLNDRCPSAFRTANELHPA